MAPQSSAADDFKTRALSAAAAAASLETAVAAMQPIIMLPLLLSAPPAAAALYLKADDGGTSAAVIDAERRWRQPHLTSCEEAKTVDWLILEEAGEALETQRWCSGIVCCESCERNKWLQLWRL